MSKMKEWAYTVERIELLFRYLELLERMQSYYVVNDRVNRVCEEIEKELGLGEQKQPVMVNVDANSKRSADDIAREIAKNLYKSAGTILRS